MNDRSISITRKELFVGVRGGGVIVNCAMVRLVGVVDINRSGERGEGGGGGGGGVHDA